MGMRYPGPVSRHNLVEPLLLWYHVPVWDCLFATTVVVLPLVGWVTQDEAQWGVGRSGRKSVMAMGEFCQSARPWIPWCG